MKILGLNQTVLEKTTLVNGIKLSPKNILFTDDNKSLKAVLLANDTIINMLLFKKDTTVYFHDNGILKSGTLAITENYNTGKYELNPSQNSTISFHPNGNLNSCSINHELNLGEDYNNIKVTGLLVFSPTKEIWQGLLSSTVRINQFGVDMGLLQGEIIAFENEGGEPRIIGGWLNDDTELKYVIAKGKNFISFYNGNSLTEVGRVELYTTPFQVYYDGLIVNGSITLYPNGNLRRGKTSQSCDYQDITFVKDTAISLFENKKLQTVYAPVQMIIQGILFPKNTTISFNQDGTVIKATQSFFP